MEYVSKFLLSIFLVLFFSQASAVENYYKCLECLSNNREGFVYCDNSNEECLESNTLQCARNDQISDYTLCPERINQEKCFNYTFTAENFNQTEEIFTENILDAGEGCWMQINRTADGSYGTVSIEYGTNRYMYIFDEYFKPYEQSTQLGLIEEQSAIGWGPRQFFVANGALMPTKFIAVYEQGSARTVSALLLLASTVAYSLF